MLVLESMGFIYSKRYSVV